MIELKGIAGESMEVSQVVYRGEDGKFYRATTKGHVGVAVEAIKAGELFEDRNLDGHFRPVKRPTSES